MVKIKNEFEVKAFETTYHTKQVKCVEPCHKYMNVTVPVEEVLCRKEK